MATRIERTDLARLLGAYWLPVGLYLALIFTLSSIPGLSVPGTFAYKDKIAHTLQYGGFGLLVHRAVKATWPQATRFRRGLLALIAIALFAVADEVFQAGTPGRDASIFDWSADVFGASLAQLLATAREKRGGGRPG